MGFVLHYVNNKESCFESCKQKSIEYHEAFERRETFISAKRKLMCAIDFIYSSKVKMLAEEIFCFIFSGVCMLITCLIHPIGWDADPVRAVCGQQADVYKIGKCKVNWAYWIAIICMVDAFVLSYLSLMFIEREIGTPNVTSRKQSAQTSTTEDFRSRRLESNGYYNQDTTTLWRGQSKRKIVTLYVLSVCF